MNTNETINEALRALEQSETESAGKPAVIRLAPDSDAYVLGNRDGFVQLAIAALQAAQGKDQSFKNIPWVDTEELDWGLHGLRYDPEAHTYLRKPRKDSSKWRSALSIVVAAAVALAFLGVLSVGIIDIVSRFTR